MSALAICTPVFCSCTEDDALAQSDEMIIEKLMTTEEPIFFECNDINCYTKNDTTEWKYVPNNQIDGETYSPDIAIQKGNLIIRKYPSSHEPITDGLNYVWKKYESDTNQQIGIYITKPFAISNDNKKIIIDNSIDNTIESITSGSFIISKHSRYEPSYREDGSISRIGYEWYTTLAYKTTSESIFRPGETEKYFSNSEEAYSYMFPILYEYYGEVLPFVDGNTIRTISCKRLYYGLTGREWPFE